MRLTASCRSASNSIRGRQTPGSSFFVVAPGADPGMINLAFDGAKKIAINEAGDLLLETASGQVRLQRPVVYQSFDGVRREIAGNYLVRNRQTVGFEIAAYNHTAPLV